MREQSVRLVLSETFPRGFLRIFSSEIVCRNSAEIVCSWRVLHPRVFNPSTATAIPARPDVRYAMASFDCAFDVEVNLCVKMGGAEMA
jgi:hypothetical protein